MSYDSDGLPRLMEQQFDKSQQAINSVTSRVPYQAVICRVLHRVPSGL